MTSLDDALADELSRVPDQSARELARRLRSAGLPVNKRQVNRILYNTNGFSNDGARRPVWHRLDGSGPPASTFARPTVTRQTLTSGRPVPSRSTVTPTPVADHPSPVHLAPRPAYDGSITLRNWQRDALEAWHSHGGRGIVEAVTGTGKTHVGLAAIDEELRHGGDVLVLVPSINLLTQWRRRISDFLGDSVTISLMGDGHTPDRETDVVIAVINSARSDRELRAIADRSLVIADECHGYGAPEHSRALRASHVRRLGLTATLERSDGGVGHVLTPYFEGVVFRYSYEDAIAEGGIIAPFRVALVGVALGDDERNTYDEHDAAMRNSFGTLVAAFGERPTIEQIAAMAGRSGYGDPDVKAARRWMASRQQRNAVVSNCRAKTTVVDDLAGALAGHRSIVFVDETARADAVAARLRKVSLRALPMHSKMDRRTRAAVLMAFRDGELDAVVAPQVLDEGVDVPEADTAVILSASSTRRQMIQRMGRVLRPKPDGRRARFLIVYAQGTYEDPTRTERHEGFLSLVTGVAEELTVCDGADLLRIGAFLDTPSAEADPLLSQTAAAPSEASRAGVETPATSDRAGRHRASGDRPSFLARVLGREPHARPRHAEPTPPASAPAPAPRAPAVTYDVWTHVETSSAYGGYSGSTPRPDAHVCSSCGGTVSITGLCRCS